MILCRLSTIVNRQSDNRRAILHKPPPRQCREPDCVRDEPNAAVRIVFRSADRMAANAEKRPAPVDSDARLRQPSGIRLVDDVAGLDRRCDPGRPDAARRTPDRNRHSAPNLASAAPRCGKPSSSFSSAASSAANPAAAPSSPAFPAKTRSISAARAHCWSPTPYSPVSRNWTTSDLSACRR